MLGKTPGRIVWIAILLGIAAVGAVSVICHIRARQEIAEVSARFVKSAVNLDVTSLGDCLASSDMSTLKKIYSKLDDDKLSMLKERAGANIEVEVVEIKTNWPEAVVTLDCSQSCGQWVLVCVRENGKWVVSLSRTLRNGKLPLTDTVGLKGRLAK